MCRNISRHVDGAATSGHRSHVACSGGVASCYLACTVLGAVFWVLCLECSVLGAVS